MIRRVLLTSAAVLSFALVAPLTADAQNFYISAGISNATGDAGDATDLGWAAAGGIFFDVGTGGWWAGVEGTYGQNGISDSDISVKPYSVMGFLGYSFPTQGNVDPYVFGGAGLQGVKIDDFNESAFGYMAGVGTAFGNPDSSVRPYGEVRFQGSSDEMVDFHAIAVLLGISIAAGSN